MALLQITLTPISSGLPSPATLLLMMPLRCTLLRFPRLPIGCDNKEYNHSVLITRQPLTSAHVDTHKIIPFLPMGSTAAVQQEDGGPWGHGTIVGHGTDDQKGRSYKI